MERSRPEKVMDYSRGSLDRRGRNLMDVNITETVLLNFHVLLIYLSYSPYK